MIYTDVWASMGEEAEIPERVKLLTPYKVTMDLLAKTENPDVSSCIVCQLSTILKRIWPRHRWNWG